MLGSNGNVMMVVMMMTTTMDYDDEEEEEEKCYGRHFRLPPAEIRQFHKQLSLSDFFYNSLSH